MNEYIEALKRYVADNPPNYGSDAHSILEMLYRYYHQCNDADTDAVKAAFEDLYQRMHGMTLREIVVGPIDGTQLGAVLEEAKAAGVYVIGYDRLLENTTGDRKSTRLNSSHKSLSRMPSSA